MIGEDRSSANPLGLFELLNYPDISVIKGSGLGGTSLINANVAIVPDREVFEQFHWPTAITYDDLQPYYQRARDILAPSPHPRAMQLAKVQALNRRAQELGITVEALNIAVNFTIDGMNPHGVEQRPCNDCGNCVCGCNVKAKNTLYMNYLPMARNAGATILTQTKVEWLEKLSGGGWRIHGQYVQGAGASEAFTLDAGEVVLSAGSLNSTEILLRSEMHGLAVSPALGTRFSGNGDFFGLAYNGDYETDVLGYPYQQAPAKGRFALARSEHRGAGALHAGTAGGPAHRRRRLLVPERLRRWRQGGLRTDSRAGHGDRQRRRAARPAGARFRPHGAGSRPERRDESLHAVPGDGAGQRAREHPV